MVGRCQSHEVIDHRAGVGPEPRSPAADHAALAMPDDVDLMPAALVRGANGVDDVLGENLDVTRCACVRDGKPRRERTCSIHRPQQNPTETATNANRRINWLIPPRPDDMILPPHGQRAAFLSDPP